jgi:hypothetical protein
VRTSLARACMALRSSSVNWLVFFSLLVVMPG